MPEFPNGNAPQESPILQVNSSQASTRGGFECASTDLGVLLTICRLVSNTESESQWTGEPTGALFLHVLHHDQKC